MAIADQSTQNKGVLLQPSAEISVPFLKATEKLLRFHLDSTGTRITLEPPSADQQFVIDPNNADDRNRIAIILDLRVRQILIKNGFGLDYRLNSETNSELVQTHFNYYAKRYNIQIGTAQLLNGLLIFIESPTVESGELKEYASKWIHSPVSTQDKKDFPYGFALLFLLMLGAIGAGVFNLYCGEVHYSSEGTHKAGPFFRLKEELLAILTARKDEKEKRLPQSKLGGATGDW